MSQIRSQLKGSNEVDPDITLNLAPDEVKSKIKFTYIKRIVNS